MNNSTNNDILVKNREQLIKSKIRTVSPSVKIKITESLQAIASKIKEKHMG